MRRLLVAVFACAVIAVSASATSAPARAGASTISSVTPRLVPSWLAAAQGQALSRIFGHPKVLHIFHIWYPNKVAVVFEFQISETCRTCSGPSQSAIPHGRIVRLTFDRRTHRIGSALQFCEVQDGAPALAVCLRR
jgi:hypothetical protein